MSDRAEIASLVERVEGWLTREEGELLYELARRCPAGTAIVEIGSFKGKSTIWLARGSLAGAGCTVFAIDPHTGSVPDRRRGEPIWTYDAFRENIRAAGVGQLVVPIVATSEQAVATFDRPIGLLFVDGEHEYPFVKRDCQTWSARVVAGGVVGFHDTMASSLNPFPRPFLPGWDGPKRVFFEQVLGSADYRHFGHAGTISYATRGACPSAERAASARRYLRSSAARRATTDAVTWLRSKPIIAENARRAKRLARWIRRPYTGVAD